MASAVRDPRYRGGYAVDGNLARELDWAVRERELRRAGEPSRRREAEREVPQALPVPKTRVRLRQAEKVSLAAVVGFAAVAVLAIVVLGQYIRLTQLSHDVVSLKSELSTLETENEVLTAQYEQIFDLSSVREAAESMGMTKPSSSQIYYLDITEGDSAVVYQTAPATLGQRAGALLRRGMNAFAEYFD